jgi:hypothetical protein
MTNPITTALPVHSLYVGSRDGHTFPDDDRLAVTDAVSSSFDCFTVVDASGYFQGRSVATLIIKIGTEDSSAIEALGHQLGNSRNIQVNFYGLIRLTDWGDLKSRLRPQHFAKAAKERT